MNKRCCNCKEDRNTELFPNRKSAKDGLNSECKICVSDRQQKNKAIKSEYDKEYNAKNRKTVEDIKLAA